VDEQRICVMGATSLVGECLLPLLTQTGVQVLAFSRREHGNADGGVEWRQLLQIPPSSSLPPLPQGEVIRYWICVAPIWVLPDYFDLLEAHGARRIVVLSSTSRFTKNDSSDLEERAVARRLAEAEERVRAWADSKDVEWVILRPTLIYGRGRDKNISEMARFIRRFCFFPVFGLAGGLRQPVHADDVAGACVSALKAAAATNRAYNLSGGETLSYREMTTRVFFALGLQPKLFKVPLTLFRFVLACVRWLPRYRHWSVAMAERMNRNLLFNYADAARDFGFSPRPFLLEPKDLPD
jgi:nucleoside-diphosphate-sugar epimerase